MGDRGVLLSPSASGGLLDALCDCGQPTRLDLAAMHDGEPLEPGMVLGPPAHQEVAFTCTGCGTAHWLTITPMDGGQMMVTAQNPGRYGTAPRDVLSWPGGWYTLPGGRMPDL
jgi:hypothetical protein